MGTHPKFKILRKRDLYYVYRDGTLFFGPIYGRVCADAVLKRLQRKTRHSNLTELRMPGIPDPRWPHGWWIVPGVIIGAPLSFLLEFWIGEVIRAVIIWVIG